jgi:hypothetical protein
VAATISVANGRKLRGWFIVPTPEVQGILGTRRPARKKSCPAERSYACAMRS